MKSDQVIILHFEMFTIGGNELKLCINKHRIHDSIRLSITKEGLKEVCNRAGLAVRIVGAVLIGIELANNLSELVEQHGLGFVACAESTVSVRHKVVGGGKVTIRVTPDL